MMIKKRGATAIGLNHTSRFTMEDKLFLPTASDGRTNNVVCQK